MEATIPSLTTVNVCDLADVTYRQIDYWIRMGLVAPSIRDAQGSGNTRRFTLDDVATVRLVKVLVANHLDHDVIRTATRADLSRDFLWVQEDLVGVGSYLDLLDALGHVQATIVVNLAAVRAGLSNWG